MTANVRRAEDRRQRREQEAFIMNELLGPASTDDLWQQARPVLDDVMHELNEEDRTVVVLRFFEGRNLREVGVALGLTENAARMRVARSLERLRGLLSQRGVKSTASTLAAALTAGAAVTAPSTLAATVASGALVAAASGGSATFTLVKLLGITKTQVAAGGMGHFFAANRARRRFGAFCDSNGAFRLQDIPAGTYSVQPPMNANKRE